MARTADRRCGRPVPTGRPEPHMHALFAAGLKNINAATFLTPKEVPQIADSEQVLEKFTPTGDVEIIGIVVNEKCSERPISTHRVTTFGYLCSISPMFFRRNQNQPPQEHFPSPTPFRSRVRSEVVGVGADRPHRP